MRGEQHTEKDRDLGERAAQEARAEPGYDRVILLLLFALFLLLSPLTEWWAADDSPWYAPYLIWALLIALSWRLHRHLDRHSAGEHSGD